ERFWLHAKIINLQRAGESPCNDCGSGLSGPNDQVPFARHARSFTWSRPCWRERCPTADRINAFTRRAASAVTPSKPQPAPDFAWAHMIVEHGGHCRGLPELASGLRLQSRTCD